MSFTSLWYLPLLIVVAYIYPLLGSRGKVCFLLAVSWFVYGLFGLPHFLLLLCVTVITYIAGIVIERSEKKKIVPLIACVVICVGMFFYIKYWNMFLSGITVLGGLFQRELTFSERYLLLPVGISFYMFQSLAYVMDVYRGQAAEKNVANYALFISFFPQLVAGPIEKSEHLLPQLKGNQRTKEDISEGIYYLFSGYIRKFVIADYVAGFVDQAYGNVVQQSGWNLLLATVFFAIQIYCDFSGYTHIAMGSARFLGIRLTENFTYPYRAKGCRDFWKRWHITLTKWFTEYVYIPLGGSRRGIGRKYFNIMVVFLLSGLWHGARVTFLCWGAFFGAWRILEDITGKKTGRIMTFLLVCLSWVFFRSQSIPEALMVLERIFTMAGEGSPLVTGMEMIGVAVRVGILIQLPKILPLVQMRRAETMRYRYLGTVLMFLITISMLSIFGNSGVSSFIYFQF